MYQQVDLAETFMSIPWFRELKPEAIRQLVTISSLHTLKAGDNLFAEGERADDLYVILDGQIELTILVPSHGKVTFFCAEPLDVIGWSSLTPFIRARTATARAACDVRMVCLDGQGLTRLCDSNHDIGYVIMRRISNVIASHLLTTRLQLYDIIMHQA
jgi:CRP-like cAMP-binding protein